MRYFEFLLKQWRIFVLFAIVLPIVVGSLSYINIPKEGNPEISVPVALVETIYPGAAPAEIESLITIPLEEALDDLDDLDEIRSVSAEGASVIWVTFTVDADIDEMIQKVKEAISDEQNELPDGAFDPVVLEIDFSEIPLMIVSIVGDIDLMALKRIADDVADDLKRMPDILDTTVIGGREREIQVNVDPDNLERYHLSLLEVVQALQSAHYSLPGGDITMSDTKYLVRPLSEIERVDQFADVMVSNVGGGVVHLRDVARVIDGFDENRSYSRVGGRESVAVTVQKRPGYNILETSAKVGRRLEELESTLPAGVKTVITADQAKYIQQDFQLMENSGIAGFFLVIIVLYLFMGLRNATLVAIAIPLSLLITFFILFLAGVSYNNMTRFSLVLCIGMLVDNAIVVVENAYHHYQKGKTRERAVIEGMSEIAMPVVAATLTTVSAFVPLLLMTGVMGEFFAFMPKTVAPALLASLGVALVATPIILSRMMKLKKPRGGKPPKGPDEDLAAFKRFYERVMTKALNHRWWVVMICLFGLWVSMVVIPQAGLVEVEMFPDADWDWIYIDIETPTGTDIEVTNAITKEVESIVVAQVPETVNMVANVGRKGASAFEESHGDRITSNYAEIAIELVDGKEFKRASHHDIMDRIRADMTSIPGADIRFRPIEYGPPTDAPILVKIVGDDVPMLMKISDHVKETLGRIKGAVDIRDDFTDATPELRAHIDRDKADRLGVSPQTIALTLRVAVAGYEAVEYRDELDDNKEFDVRVRLERDARSSVDDLKAIKVRSLSGSLVPLGALVDFEVTPGITAIRHVDLQRVVRVTAQDRDRSAVEITTELQEALADYEMPEGYWFSYAGDFEETEESFRSLKVAYCVAFLLIITILVAQFNSFAQPFAIIVALPLSIIGAMFGLAVTGNNFSIMSFIGVVGLSGIVVNDAIVLVDCINRFRKKGFDHFEAIVNGGKERLRPIISTTVTTIGGLITLTITDKMWEGLGVVIIFGIAFASVLTLVVVPTLYMMLENLSASLSSIIRSLFRRPFPAPPDGARTFFSSRRRLLTVTPITVLVVLVGLQGLLLFVGWPSWLGPTLHELFTTPIRATSFLKLGIEAVTRLSKFGIMLAIQFFILLLPTWIALGGLIRRHAKERAFIAIGEEALTIRTLTGVFEAPWSEVISIKKRRFLKGMLLQIGWRRLPVGALIERPQDELMEGFRDWLRTPPPPRERIREDTTTCREAIAASIETKNGTVGKA